MNMGMIRLMYVGLSKNMLSLQNNKCKNASVSFILLSFF